MKQETIKVKFIKGKKIVDSRLIEIEEGMKIEEIIFDADKKKIKIFGFRKFELKE